MAFFSSIVATTTCLSSFYLRFFASAFARFTFVPACGFVVAAGQGLSMVFFYRSPVPVLSGRMIFLQAPALVPARRRICLPLLPPSSSLLPPLVHRTLCLVHDEPMLCSVFASFLRGPADATDSHLRRRRRSLYKLRDVSAEPPPPPSWSSPLPLPLLLVSASSQTSCLPCVGHLFFSPDLSSVSSFVYTGRSVQFFFLASPPWAFPALWIMSPCLPSKDVHLSLKVWAPLVLLHFFQNCGLEGYPKC